MLSGQALSEPKSVMLRKWWPEGGEAACQQHSSTFPLLDAFCAWRLERPNQQNLKPATLRAPPGVNLSQPTAAPERQHTAHLLLLHLLDVVEDALEARQLHRGRRACPAVSQHVDWGAT